MVFISSPSFSLFLVISYPSSVLLLFAPFIGEDVLQTHPHNYRCSPILFCIWAFLQHTFISNPCLALWCCRRGGASLSSRSYRASGDGNLCKDVALLQPGELPILGALRYHFHAGAFGRVCDGSLGAGQLWARSCQALAKQSCEDRAVGPWNQPGASSCVTRCLLLLRMHRQELCKRGPSHEIEEEGLGFLSVASKSFVQNRAVSSWKYLGSFL